VIRFDHLRVPVTDLARSRRWYVETLGLTVEFDVPDRQTVALQDSSDFTIFLQQVPARVEPLGCALWFQVDASMPRTPSGRGVASRSRMPRASPTGDTGPSSRIPTDTSCVSGTSAR
jgi:catechol 2,3-dioxygenase-like lactoylglutathione lyase family enzyme